MNWWWGCILKLNHLENELMMRMCIETKSSRKGCEEVSKLKDVKNAQGWVQNTENCKDEKGWTRDSAGIPLESQISYSLLFTTFNLYSGSGRVGVNKPSI